MARFSYLALGTTPRSGGLPILRPALPSLALPSETRPAAPASPIATTRTVARVATPAPATPAVTPLATALPAAPMPGAPAPIVDPPLTRAKPPVLATADPRPDARAPLPTAAPVPARLQPDPQAEGYVSAPLDPPLRVAHAAAPDAVPTATARTSMTMPSTADRQATPHTFNGQRTEPARLPPEPTAPHTIGVAAHSLDDAVPMRAEPPSRNAVPGDHPARPRADSSPRAAARSVDVRIGTIEIHSAPAPAPRPVASATPRPAPPAGKLATGYRWGGR